MPAAEPLEAATASPCKRCHCGAAPRLRAAPRIRPDSPKSANSAAA